MDIPIFVIFLSYLDWGYSWHEIPRQPPHTKFYTYPFEGVDYSELPDEYAKQHNDCYAYYLRCIRYRTDLHAVCGLNTYSGYLEDFFSPCQIDFMNCQHRMSKGHGVVGINYKDDLIAYNGEGNKCEYYLRSAGSSEGALRMYKHTIPIIVNKKELNILRKGENMVRVFKGNMNFDQNLIDKIDSMFVKEKVKSSTYKGDIGFKNNSISNIDPMPIGKLDGTLKLNKGNIPMPRDIISTIDSLFAGNGDEISRFSNGIGQRGINPEINLLSKDKGERLIDQLILMNKDLDEMNLGM